MTAARIDASGKVYRLDGSILPRAAVTPADVQEPAKLARLVAEAHRAAAEANARANPRRIDHEDVAVDNTGTTKYRFEHGFGGRVRWWVVGWSGASAGPQLIEDGDTGNDTLVLVSKVAGTVTVRIEEAG